MKRDGSMIKVSLTEPWVLAIETYFTVLAMDDEGCKDA
jgi:hypothetical protein